MLFKCCQRAVHLHERLGDGDASTHGHAVGGEREPYDRIVLLEQRRKVLRAFVAHHVVAQVDEPRAGSREQKRPRNLMAGEWADASSAQHKM